MRRFLALPSLLAMSFFVSSAFATTNEPNGLQIPRDSMNGEVQLYTLFANRGEPIDWLADAGTQPNTFSPLCDFTATFVLNEAGSHFGLAWYNETGSAPQPSDLHVIMPANTPVGTMITSANIKNDPAYLGGLIGFALVGGQTHYSNPTWDPVCSGCTPAAPWISAVIYASKTTPNAFYVAFEDGNMGANPNQFSNDGDFNDDVFFLTGLVCAGGGQPCDTGMPGVCAAGLTQCTPNGVICVQSNPSKMETCNGVDDDCNGMVDDGNNLCPTDFVCDKGTCVKKCGTGEFICDSSKVCDQGFCVDPACKGVSCDPGKVCVDGMCKAPCDGVVCPYPQVCRVGACVDPCAGVTCDTGQVCQSGVCVASCSCAPCASGTACDDASGQCVDPSCVGVMCPGAQHCVGGACVDDCMGAMCPSGQECKNGQCVASMGSGQGGGSPTSTGAFGTGGGTNAGGGNGSSNGGAGGISGSGGNGNSGSNGGCGCRLGDEPRSGALGLGLVAGLALLAARRRRTRR